MHGRRFRLIGWIALAVGGLLAGCSQLPANLYNGPTLGILSRGQISFSSLSFSSVNNNPWSELIPSASGVAKGLGNGSWNATLDADMGLVYGCWNNGSNTPYGVFNFYAPDIALGSVSLAPTTKNGKSAFDIGRNADAFWVAFNAYFGTDGPDQYGRPGDTTGNDFYNQTLAEDCPNTQNYYLAPVGGLWNNIYVHLVDATTGDVADTIKFHCSDPANPSADTCTIQ